MLNKMENNTVKIRFEIDLDLLSKLEDLAEEAGQTIKETMVKALTDYVELYEDTGAESLDDHLEPYEITEEFDEDGQVIRVFPEDDGC
jgi:predicted transcriptional regulator